ncbi:uncharacterized protein PHACADRAFT_252445 [Phanerochaete carnosa HHB-10118-sp]|uniref:SH3 domain-containing protein n=1 Tax=Phanerochaete carnosa (strain HHB-10118-sp) TaxID=650164 RepID=K5WG16_PHACS|nr:uncharacterized protein PHACADRAFT_252445 [Phanerochaete carnosa HHB-10118-sp]EKM58255.1 hypothetical protein PHACADRAFT_252445 [Phanerochaete carnosa HHB-10118-sp]
MAPSVFGALQPIASLVSRDETPDQTDQKKLTPTLIGGIVIAAVLAVLAVGALLFRVFRKRASSKREAERGAAFLNVRGLVREDDQKSSGLAMHGGQFSREQMTESVVLPARVVIHADGADANKEILDHYAAQGALPKPFAPFMGSTARLAAPSPEEEKSANRQSTASWISISRNSLFAPSNRSSISSIASSMVSSSAGGDKRKVRQMFNPVLPDELVVSLGESLTVVNSFDDGWCIVGRDSVFKPGEVELGAIPAWCFMKPVQGLRAERPMRTSSLGVTVTLEAEPGARNDVISWSNF